MPSIKRRKFLQFLGASTLTTLSLEQLNLLQKGSRYPQVLAQNTPRKLALLIGINTYRDRQRFTLLQGCLTDVELQRQLLTHRFGFNPQNILTLTEERAKYQAILTAFEEHLIKQAQPEDIVVLHFSGYGFQGGDSGGEVCDCLPPTLVPMDSLLQPDGTILEITGQTLWLLIAALKTENVTVVIDVKQPGNIVDEAVSSASTLVEAQQSRPKTRISSLETAYQQQWLERLSLSPTEFQQRWRTGISKGVMIQCLQREIFADERVLGNGYAGTLTYLMTQYLWQQTGKESVRTAIANITRSIVQQSAIAQPPQLIVKPKSGNELRPIYFLEWQTPPAEAVITDVEGERVKVWLGGIEPQSLLAFNQGAILTLVDRFGQEQGLVKLESRQGLVGLGRVLEAKPQAVRVGAFLQERIRVIPRNLTLKIALDASLGENLTHAQSLLQALPYLQVLATPSQDSDYSLGCITTSDRVPSQLASAGSIGLFLPGRVLVPGSFGTSDETIMAAVHRLQPKLKSLLATQVVKLALNSNSSRLNVTARMTQEGGAGGMLAQSVALRGSPQKQGVASAVEFDAAPVLPLAIPVQLHITNHETRDLYCSILVIDATREISVLFPNQWAAAEDVTRVKAGQILLVPDPSKDAFRLVTQEPKGKGEVLIIASSKPLRKTLLSLRAIAQRGGQKGGPVALDAANDSTDVVANLLDDLDASNAQGDSLLFAENGVTATHARIHRLDTTQLAVMSISYEVI
jgi:hypothetical protein